MTDKQKLTANLIEWTANICSHYGSADAADDLRLDLAFLGYFMASVDGKIAQNEVDLIADMLGPINGQRFSQEMVLDFAKDLGAQNLAEYCVAPPSVFERLITFDKLLGNKMEDGITYNFITVITDFADEIANADGYVDNGELKAIEAYTEMLKEHVADMFK